MTHVRLALALAVAALLAGVGAILLAGAAHAAPGDYLRDADGRLLRVGFDPGERLFASVGAGFRAHGGPGLALDLGLLLAGETEDSGVLWKLRHGLALAAWDAGDRGRLVGTVYTGHFLRWSADGSLVLPGSPPVRVAFPFDIGLSVTAGRVDWALDAERARVRVIDATLLFDVARSRAPGTWAAFGFGPAYDLAVVPGAVTQIVAPFSRLVLDLHHTWGAGKALCGLRGEAAYAWRDDGRWGAVLEADASCELVVLAVNDAPLALRVAADWRHSDLVPGDVLNAVVGVRLGVPLSR